MIDIASVGIGGEDIQILDHSLSPQTMNIEFFHIYTDEIISEKHSESIRILKSLANNVDSDTTTIIMIDNYNPTNHILAVKDVLEYLRAQNALPDYWAYESDMVGNAKILLSKMTSEKLRNSYLKYIEKNQKYPCSLLTASWYLTRLGYLDNKGIIKSTDSYSSYVPTETLVNLLPESYRGVEKKAFEIITSSEYKHAVLQITDKFYENTETEAVKLF